MGSWMRLHMNMQKDWKIKLKILVTGGAEYIGSHSYVELLNASHEVSVMDNLCNGSRAALEGIQDITNSELQFINLDIINFNI